ncbi:Lrp/AsnC family transcriptional regulator [Phenylobacterium aquaticum]|uniref:Lrp/AsnC family transcriptional regulator n=1 Tax=Phenylobacterium aquaticum TaxID=1763816 RepID=UPI001F5CF88C|nr:Lrp/AsnC family transcriptional regulator [Phenylobacterium aquaticum]MCI3133544.1 Lrp/AsnC family transcriptional regulator [Phenylobacterium aquaticum]
MNSEPKLDNIDRRILAALAEDGRGSLRDLAEKVGLSQTPLLRRVRRLEKDGVITGYGARLDERKLGYAMSAYVAVTLSTQSEEALAVFEREISRAPEVMSCFLMTGGSDYMLRVVVPSLDAYEHFLTRRLTRIPNVAHIQSSFALRAVIQRTSPPAA